MDDRSFFTGMERKCPVCGRLFMYRSNLWVYRDGSRIFCSWGCMRELEKKPEKRPITPAKIDRETEDKIRNRLKFGIRPFVVAEDLNVTRDTVYRINRQMREEKKHEQADDHRKPDERP